MYGNLADAIIIGVTVAVASRTVLVAVALVVDKDHRNLYFIKLNELIPSEQVDE